MAEPIFRDAALERLSTPEQLDRLVRVSRPLGWLALGAFFAACLLALVWSAFVALPLRVPAQGMLVAPEGVVEVMTASRGRVAVLLVKPGDKVRAGQEVARLEQPDIAQGSDRSQFASEVKTDKQIAQGHMSGSFTGNGS